MWYNVKKEKGGGKMLHLLLSSDWVAVRDEILARMAGDVRQQRAGGILMVPELISHDMERRLCSAAGDTASRFAEVLSFTGLARRVAETAGRGAGECMDAGGRVVVMAAAARGLSSRLKAYGSVQTNPEFLSALVDAVDEFKRCCITPADLAFAAKQAEGSLAQKLEELSLIMEGYDALCAHGKRDPRDLMNWLLQRLEDCDFGEKHIFYVDGFPDFTRQHLAILEHLIKVSPEVTVGLNCDRPETDAMAYEKASQTAAQLIRCAKNAGVEVKIEYVQPQNGELGAVCGKLFQGKLPDGAMTDKVCAVQADSAWHEVQLTAEKIMDLVRGGCRYRDISVVCTDMASYGHLISLHFKRCGIPAYIAGTEDVLQKSAVVSVLAALDAALGGFEQRDVLRYLRSAMSVLSQEECDLVENYAILWGIRGNAWLAPWVKNPDGLTDLWNDHSRGLLERLNNYRAAALEPLRRLHDGFRDASDLAGQMVALYNFLDETDFAGSLADMAKELDSEGDNRGVQVLNQLWQILLSAMEQMHDALGQTVWEEDALIRLFTLLLSRYDVGTIPPVLDAVTVGSVSAMRCQQPKHLFVLGALEGHLPGYSGAAGIFSDQERVAVRKFGVPLTGGALEGLQAEFAEVYGVFCGAQESITVLCPVGQPSYVFKRLAKMAGGVTPAWPVYGPAAHEREEAAYCLARWDREDEAGELGVAEEYRDARAKMEYAMGNISADRVRSLYGDRILLSASQIDRQAECRMSYFLKYGMRAQERKEATVDPAEFGTFVHDVLERTAGAVMELGGFEAVSLDKTMEIAFGFADEYMQQKFSQIDSQRVSYLLQRNRGELEMVVAELWRELKDSAFRPCAFELEFSDTGAMPAIEIPTHSISAALRGLVDRVDLWEKDGQKYFRVVDYKTGKKTLDYCDIFNGVGLQMLLYLFALEQSGDALLGDQRRAAGVLYFPARAPVMDAPGALTDEEAVATRKSQWQRSGLLLNSDDVIEAMDPGESGVLCCKRSKDGSLVGDLASSAQLRQLREYVFACVGAMVDDIASGNVEPNPYTRGTTHDACRFCPFGAVCHAVTVEGRRDYKTMTQDRFWEEVGKEAHNG